VFTPADTTKFSGSMSPPVLLTVTPPIFTGLPLPSQSVLPPIFWPSPGWQATLDRNSLVGLPVAYPERGVDGLPADRRRRL
jgi:hypothetical protein